MFRETAGQKRQLFGLCYVKNWIKPTSLPSLLLILFGGRVGISHRDRTVIKSTYGSTRHISFGIQIKRCKYGIITGLCTKSFLVPRDNEKRWEGEGGSILATQMRS